MIEAADEQANIIVIDEPVTATAPTKEEAEMMEQWAAEWKEILATRLKPDTPTS